MTIEDLEASLAAVSLAEAPDEWALAAYRLAVARSETAGRGEDLEQALELLDKAARILSADRAPVEHGRILTAAANCHRGAGRAERALEFFVRAAELLAPRAPVLERAGVLINVGLARCEIGRPELAIEVLDQAISLLAEGSEESGIPTSVGADGGAPVDPLPDRHATPRRTDDGRGSDDERRTDDGRGSDDEHETDDGRGTDDERGRVLGAALINRAQARQSLGRDEDLLAALDDYRDAVAALATSSLQAGMAAHGLGATVLELCRRGAPCCNPDDAVGAFEQALGVLGPIRFPFHHAVARHSLALAYEARRGPLDLARALNSAHASLSVFDPRLHTTHWRTAHDTLARITDALGGDEPSSSRLSHVARLLAHTPEEEREQLLRDRLFRAAHLPATAARADLETLFISVAALPVDGYRTVLRSLIGVLMELPDRLLEAACETVCRVHAEHHSPEALDEVLDSVITDRLFGPQRVRVRDLLEANGWVRP